MKLDTAIEDSEQDYGDSDDSAADPSLVSDHHVKVLQLSVKTLKSKLLEKCQLVEDLEKKLLGKENELEKLRMLNRGLQETVLERVSSMLSSPRNKSLPPSR